MLTEKVQNRLLVKENKFQNNIPKILSWKKIIIYKPIIGEVAFFFNFIFLYMLMFYHVLI